jgi:hypothetical protein
MRIGSLKKNSTAIPTSFNSRDCAELDLLTMARKDNHKSEICDRIEATCH